MEQINKFHSLMGNIQQKPFKYYGMPFLAVYFSVLFSNIYSLNSNQHMRTGRKHIFDGHRNYHKLIILGKATLLSVFWPFTIYKIMTNPKHVLTFGGKYKLDIEHADAQTTLSVIERE